MSILYFPIDSPLRSDCEALSSTYYLKEFIGKGAYGKVYQACRKGTADCGYVLKTIKFDHDIYMMSNQSTSSLDEIHEEWKNEVEVMKQLNQSQDFNRIRFSPILYDAWYCEKGEDVEFYILMEKFEGDLRHLIKKSQTKDFLVKAFIIQTLRLMEAYLTIIHTTCGICLNDIKLANILYKLTEKGEFVFVFSDFGKSTLYSNEQCIREDKKAFERQIDSLITQLTV